MLFILERSIAIAIRPRYALGIHKNGLSINQRWATRCSRWIWAVAIGLELLIWIQPGTKHFSWAFLG
jgi:hypothetical protein